MDQIQIQHNEVLSLLADATQHRNAMSAMFRNTPNQNNKEWRDDANLEVHRLRRQERRLGKSKP